MSNVSAEFVYRLANVLLSASTFTVAALIVVAIGRRPGRKFEPLGLAFCAFFLAVGLRSAVRVTTTDLSAVPVGLLSTLVAVDGLAALAGIALVFLRRRYDLVIESAGVVREYETEYAEKEREARSLAQVNEELRRLDELKSEFLAMVSHELRTPLTAIIGYSRLLIRQVHGSLTPKQLEQQEAIFRGAQRLTDLINDLLDVSRLEAGRVELQPRPTDVRQAVAQAISVVAVAAQAKQIRVTNALGPELPPIKADPTRLQQILVNLLGNAVKFTPAAGAVRVYGGRQRDHVWIAVEDTGVGIERDELARIWDPFYQVEAPLKRQHGGSGLGLAIVRRLVELHGGLVRAESEGTNRGSRFIFTVPAAEGAVAVPAPAEPDAVERILSGRRVLIVEDERENQELMRVVIEDVLGATVTVCSDGERGLAEAVERPPDLVLLDLMLPGLSGWEVARRLRQSPRTWGVPIVAVSALARPQEREAALHAGCDAYLPKPFTPEEMARVVSSAVPRRRVA
jgi:signal transduction histidine kinase/ActR/RegA family two-component response regulator